MTGQVAETADLNEDPTNVEPPRRRGILVICCLREPQRAE
jgi:hypothetical protein